VVSLISLQQARARLKLDVVDVGSPPSIEDADAQLLLDQAEAVILDRVKQRVGPSASEWAAEVDAWTADTVPPLVSLLIVLQFGDLWRFRNDDLAGDAPKREHGRLSPAVESYLARLSDPAVA
jgi:hypothetical protein